MPTDTSRPRYINTFDRVVAHYDNRDGEPKESITMSAYKPTFNSLEELHETQSFPNQRKAMLDALAKEEGRRKFETTYQCSICLPKPPENPVPPLWATGARTDNLGAEGPESHKEMTTAEMKASIKSLY